MEESELEEGEACSYHDNRGDNDYDSSIDPDVALSYIDEKIQDVLGHFQKDFEGGISAENLGAKFGGYGSFLPAYQRSLSNSMSPSKVQEDYAPRPSKTIPMEAKHLGAFRNAISMPSTKDLMKKEGSLPSICTEEFDSRCESGHLSNQKMKKLQLKVGPDNVSTQKRAAIYSGLGLDVSPSSSLEESLSRSEGMLHEHQDAPFESPTFILQIMTSFPVPGGLPLSPLPNNLLKLAKMENAQEDSRCVVVSSLGERGSNCIKDVRKVSCRKKVKSLDNDDNSAASLSGKTKCSRSSNAAFGSKESEIDKVCKEMVSRTMQLPFLSNVDTAVDYITRSSSEALRKSSEDNDGIMREKGFGDLSEEEKLNHKLTHSSGVEKAEVYPEFLEDREVPATNCLVQGKDCYKGQEKYGFKASFQKQYHLDMPLTKEKISFGGKERSKASQNQVKLAADVPEGSLSGLSSNTRNLNSIQGGESNSETELGEFKADRNSHNSDRYKDLFGDMDFEEDQNRMVMQGPEMIKKSISVPNTELRERLKGKIDGKLSAIEAHLDAAPEVVPGSDLPMLGKAVAAGAHFSEEDKWVYCDKCQKCRLLPPGTNPEDLPDKWLCSMLDWLPSGMNNCSVSLEETTNAVRAMCQATIANAQSHVKGNPGLSNIVSDSPHDDEMNIHSLQMLPGEVNKRCPAEISDFVKKSRQISSKTRSLNDAKDSSLEGEDDLQQLSKSSHGRAAIQATKQKVPKDSSEDDVFSKKRFRRMHDRDHSKSSKKARNTGTNYGDEDWTSERDVLIMRTGNNSDGTVLTGLRKERQKCQNEASLNISAYDTAGKSDYMVGYSSRKATASMDDEIVEARAPDGGDFLSKRIRMKESKSYPASLSSVPSGGHHREKGILVVENECKEAKVGVINSKEKEPSANRGNRRIDEETCQIKQSNNDLASTGLASTERGLRLTQPPVAAACSSSKASGSLKIKANFHDMRGSPAESVSSSPRRSLKPDNLTLARQTISDKHDFDDAAIIPIAGACSNGGVVGRIDQCRSDTKVETTAAAANGSLESSILDPDRDNFSGNSEKAKVAPSPDISNRPSLHSGEDIFGDDNKHRTRPVDSDKCSAGERKNEERSGGSSLNIKGSEKLSSSRSKDKKGKSQPEGMENSKLFHSFKDRQDCATDKEGKPRDVRSNQEITSVKGEEVEGKRVKEKDSAGKSCWNSKRKSLSNPGDARCSEHAISSPDCDDCELSLKKITLGKAKQVEISSEKEKPLALHDVSTYHKEIIRESSKLVPKSQSTDGVENMPAARSSDDEALKMPRQIKKADHHNRDQQKSSHHFTSNGHRVRDVNAPVRRNSASHAAVNALKEAKDLKHLADRVKNGVSNGESIVLYFQAALKFLHGAALLESSNGENSKRGDMIQSIQIYGSTAKLCEFCAHEYEKSKDMASAALAYKCMEVAYLKVVYSSHNNAGKDREELQTTLKIPSGESPSALDIDNVNNTANLEKVGQSKAASSPQVAGSQTVATKRPNFARLLNFAQNVSSAMEASRKSRIAFSAASTSSSDPKFKEAILSIKTALDYNFQDVEGLLRLVRLATEAISR